VSQSFLAFLFAVLTAASPSGGAKSVQPAQPMSQEEMESRVRIDAARELNVQYGEVGIIETTERTWTDQSLGCKSPARPGAESASISGFRIAVKIDKRRLTYHTDRFGRVVQCTAATAAPASPAKP
jgi:hypothetical protein